jgi:hypothetical protein
MNKNIPAEYRAVVAGLFPESAWARANPPGAALIDAFADALGIACNYARIKLSIAQEDQADVTQARDTGGNAYDGGLRRFLPRFQENFSLMIAKTWVEKGDEDRKSRLQEQLLGFVALIERKEFAAALASFSSLIHELAYLLFGDQSKKDDFLEYTFRIDPPMGLFFWYGLHLDVFFEQDNAAALSMLLPGMCYLADF